MIETERLFIRPLQAADAETVLTVWGDPVNERFAGATAPASVEHVLSWLSRWEAWGVWERATGELVGDCSLHFDEGYQEWELSYGLRRDRWGRGYATEAARACVRYGFDVLGHERIVADTASANVASQHVLEKVGFVQTGRDGDKVLFELTRESFSRSSA